MQLRARFMPPCFFAAACLCSLGRAADSAPPRTELLPLVRRAVDALVERGTDRWGSERTAMIISILDRRTLEPPQAKMPRAPAGVRAGDRTNAFGSNANLQQNLYETMFQLSEVTGDAKYRDAATAALVDFVRRTQSPATELLGWGEHLFYDLNRDAVGTDDAGGTPHPPIHEMKRKFLHWDLLYAREPERVLKFARGLWDHQIYDHKTGDFSRHANWDKHNPRRGFDFTKEGGYMIDVWARAYEASDDPTFVTAVDVLAGRYRGKLNDRNLLDYDSTRKNYCNNGHNVTLATECDRAAPRFAKAPPTAARLHELAASIDRGFLSCAHAPSVADRGFIASCLTENGEPCDREGPGPGGYSVTWGMGYGKQSTAMIGLHCYHRSRQLGDSTAGRAYRELFFAAAERYRATSIPRVEKKAEDKLDVWAVEPATAIFLELAAFRATDDAKYLAAADRLADEAVAAFFDSSSPLPKASLLSSHYEVMCGPDTLLLSLLAVACEHHNPPHHVPITDIER